MLQKKLHLQFFLQKELLFLLFFAVALKCFYFYLPFFAMRISFVTLPLVAIGWIYGAPAGFFSGILTDLISMTWENSFSWLFLFQPALMGLIGGVMRYFQDYSLFWLNVPLHAISLNFFNPIFVLISLLLTSVLSIKYKGIFNVLLINALIVSLIYGTYCASQFSPLPITTLLSARMAKESLKIILSTLPLSYLLKNE